MSQPDLLLEFLIVAFDPPAQLCNVVMTDSETARQPHESSEKVYAAIGAVADAWANLEFDINEAIWELANAEQQAGACITSQIISIGGRTRARAALVGWRGGNKDLLGRVNKFGSEVEGLGRQRNRIIHDPWYVRNDTHEPHHLSITADRILDSTLRPCRLNKWIVFAIKFFRLKMTSKT